MGRPGFGKRKVLVDSFQHWLVGVEMAHFVIAAAIFVTALFTPVIIDLYSGDIESVQVQEAARNFLFLHARVWIPLLLAMGLFAMHNILVSHKIAGPLYRIRNVMGDVSNGDLSQRVSIRHDDRMHKEADQLNQMITSLDDKMTMLSSEVSGAQQLLSLVERKGDITDVEIAKMRSYLSSCEATLRGFKTRGEPWNPSERRSSVLKKRAPERLPSLTNQ